MGRAPLAVPLDALRAWWIQGLRTALFQRPDWGVLQLTPATLGLLWLVPAMANIGLERLGVVGPATFYGPALLVSGWLTLVVWLVLAWALVHGKLPDAGPPHGPGMLVALLLAQSLPVSLLLSLVFVPQIRGGVFDEGSEHVTMAWALWYVAMAWQLAAQCLLLWRASAWPPARRVAACLLLVGVEVLAYRHMPVRHWYPARPEPGADAAAPKFRLTQPMFEAQGAALARDLQALVPQRDERIDVYAITYAPYADEDVFLRESELVAGVMQERFDATGRTVQLVSRRDDVPTKAWATPLNLQRAIERAAALMDRDEDVLFLHLTSHGARNGELASSMWPLEVESLTPQRLAAMLDAAGIKHRVISVSACYSGSWIAPLSGEHVLVMSAADAEHTSYGCGRHSELTYFGRAMFDEQLRRTRSFEAAHAAARGVIDQREKEAGKTDGYSNPQIAVGGRMRDTLSRLEAQLARD